MPHKTQLTEHQKELLNHTHSQLGNSRIGPIATKPTMSDIKRKARNKRKSAAKIQYRFQPLPSRSGNPKKNHNLRRQRGKSGVYIPYVLLNIGEFRSNKYQKKINKDLINRAYQARQDGGYFHINSKASHDR